MTIWNPWHGCKKLSAGCANCYMYRRDASVGRDSTIVAKTAGFRLPVQRKRDGSYKLNDPETVFACMTSDFFLEDADAWRPESWAMIRERSDLHFTIITKRISRFTVGLPADWGGGWPHVTVCVTCENQQTADSRIPVLLSLPVAHRQIIHEPMLEAIDIAQYLQSGLIGHVSCGGESGENARLCRYEWILSTRGQCMRYGVPFTFRQTGACFEKDGKIYRIPRALQLSQAKKAGISTGGAV